MLLLSESEADASLIHTTPKKGCSPAPQMRPQSSALPKASSPKVKTPLCKTTYTGLFSLSPEAAIAHALRLPEKYAITTDSYHSTDQVSSTSQPSVQKKSILQVPATASSCLISESPPKKIPAKALYLSRESTLFQVDLSDPISTGSSSPIKLSPSKIVPNIASKKTAKLTAAPTKVHKVPSSKSQANKVLKEANKVTRKKEEILSEMILQISLPLHDSMFDDEYLQAHFKESNVRKTYSRLPLISWRRKVKADYDLEKDIFIPCEQKEIKERILVLYYTAGDLIAKIHDKTVTEEIRLALESERLHDGSLSYHMIIVVEGYDLYVAKIKQQESKKYQAEVLSQVQPCMTASQSNKRKAQEPLKLPVKADDIEGLMTSCMIANNVTIFPVKNNKDGIEWLLSFTYTIGSAYYDKYNRNIELSNLGRVKSGTDKRSTFLESIKQFKYMTTPKAEQLHGFYPSIVSIYDKYSSSDSLGTFGGKNVLPPLVDGAMKKLLTSDDPNAMINE